MKIGLRFLILYSAVVTVAFMLTVYFGFVRPVHGASSINDFDRIRVHRIDIVEPDGTERLILSNRADYPGSFYHGKEIARPDRNDSAGLLFINEEGTEDGGLIYSGARDKDGKISAGSHLSFDQYDQDQTLVLERGDEDGKSYSKVELGEQPSYPLTPQVFDEIERFKSMPDGPEKQKARTELQKKYPYGPTRVLLRKNPDSSASLTLSAPQGKARLKIVVGADGTPQIQFLNADGKVLRTINATP